MGKVFVNGVTMAYERLGEGKPLMLIHGFPLDHSIWNQTVELLANDFDMILPDLRGFGGSAALDSVYTMTDMADDLAALLDSRGVKNIALVGHSMGGYVALAFAAKYPYLVDSLALIGSQTLADTPEKRDGRYKTAQQVQESGVSVVADAMTAKFSANPETQSVIRELILRQNKAGVIGALKAMAERDDLTSLFTMSDHPFVMIHGDADELIPVERAREAKPLRPSAQLFELPGVGHLPMMDAPEKTAEALRFLR
jgi:pimeloyl-ACP methyl ester carboxylesterase